MKTSTIRFAAAIAAIALSASAFAQSPYSKTRAEVKAETVRALAAGEISSGGEGYPALSHPHFHRGAPTQPVRAAAPAAAQSEPVQAQSAAFAAEGAN